MTDRTWEQVKEDLHQDDPELRELYEESEPAYQVARELIRIRAEQGLSQSEVARRMNTAPSVISRLEQMETTPSLKTVFALAKALGHRVEIRFVPEGAEQRVTLDANVIFESLISKGASLDEPLTRGEFLAIFEAASGASSLKEAHDRIMRLKGRSDRMPKEKV